MILKVLTYGDPRLLEMGEPITEFDDKLNQVVENLIDTMYDTGGMGLAAQQVGYALRVFVMDLRGAGEMEHYLYDGKQPPVELICPLVLINPEVTPIGDELSCEYEGCISFPEMRGDVVRHYRAQVKFQDLAGAWHTLECSGYAAHCLQHEVDHLNGVLFTDRMEPREYNKLLPKLKKIKRMTRDFLKKESKEKR